MFGFIIFLHAAVCIFLALIILMQSGRGGGLTESFSAAESMFGAKTNIVLVRATTILAGVFIMTCLSLAFLSSKSHKSLIQENAVNQEHSTDNAAIPIAETGSHPTADTQKTGENANLEQTETKQVTDSGEPKNPQ